MSFARYPEYKDSGVEWLGEVPGHWEVVRLNTTATCNDEVLLESTAEDYEIEYVEISGVQAGQGITETATLPFGNAPSRARRVVRDGDVLISTVRTYLRAIAQVKSPPENMIASTGFAVLRPRRIDSRFLGYACHAEGFVSDVIARSVGVSYPAINASELARLPIPLPTAPEQTAIATFLDRETAKIDALVAEQEKLIALLQEKRQAVISHAVTKGLNPNVPMKDSGVEWLGEVPGHWAVGKCGFYLQILSGFAFPSSGFTDDDSDHRLLRGANVGVSRLKWDDTVYWKRSEDDGLDDYEMVEGDLVIGMDRPLIGEGMRVAKVTAEDLPSLLLQRVASLKVGNKLHADYLHYLLASEMFVAHFSPETTGVSVPHISPDQINKFIIPIPPMSEQLAIVNDVKRLLAEFGGLIAESEIAVGLLQERRTALISAAVTGQIDVRGLVGGANAPDSVAASAYPASA